jgi:hypothetical protein
MSEMKEIIDKIPEGPEKELMKLTHRVVELFEEMVKHLPDDFEVRKEHSELYRVLGDFCGAMGNWSLENAKNKKNNNEASEGI